VDGIPADVATVLDALNARVEAAVAELRKKTNREFAWTRDRGPTPFPLACETVNPLVMRP
jgi:hypothetical protein